jgi:hypothetical protein
MYTCSDVRKQLHPTTYLYASSDFSRYPFGASRFGDQRSGDLDAQAGVPDAEVVVLASPSSSQAIEINYFQNWKAQKRKQFQNISAGPET